MQFRLRELMILMAVLPPIGGWLWFAHHVPLMPYQRGLFGFNHVVHNGTHGYDAGAITVAAVMMGLAIMAAIAFHRRSENSTRSPPSQPTPGT